MLGGCDQGTPDLEPSQGPPLHVLASYPAPGEGTECGLNSPDACGVPRNLSIELRFDRYLLPWSGIRQSLRVYSGSEDVSEFLQPEYDVVERVLSLRIESTPNGDPLLLEPGARYTVELLVPKSENDFGLRAFDQAPIEEGDVPLSFDFRTQKLDPPPLPAPPGVLTCGQFITELANGPKCSTGGCHAGNDAPMGLRFDGDKEFVSTAVNHVAHETETGAKAGVPLTHPSRMGVQMPIVEPSNPGNSYMMYKLLRNPNNFSGDGGVGCATTHTVALPAGVCPEPSAAESERLARYFVKGLPMPHTDSTVADLRKIQAFIRGDPRAKPPIPGAFCPSEPPP